MPLRYLRALGVPVESAVGMVIVSHWDDDHARGVADIIEACSSAKLCWSPPLTTREFYRFVEAVSTASISTEGANVSSFRRVMSLVADRGDTVLNAGPGRRLLGAPAITALSPSDHESQLFLEFVAKSHPKAGESARRVVLGSPNLTSIVLNMNWEHATVLLGADMETHPNPKRGWTAVVDEARRTGVPKGEVVKIPHHGSHTGHYDGMWTELLCEKPISAIAPFGRGPVEKRPPKSSDINRINKLSSSTYLTARHVIPKSGSKDIAVVRSLREGQIKLYGRKSPLGIVRFRKVPGADWQIDTLGAAVRVK